jgi:hypothetical protein
MRLCRVGTESERGEDAPGEPISGRIECCISTGGSRRPTDCQLAHFISGRASCDPGSGEH